MSIPVPILAACAGLILLFAVFATRMLSEGMRTLAATRRLEGILRGEDAGSPPHGLTAAELADLRQKCGALADPERRWWRRIDENLIALPSADGGERWYLAAPAREILPEVSVSERYYHGSFHEAVPGILTGLGLACTFIAILVALTALRVTMVNDTETVMGIRELIEGLAGKFLTSIVGLLLSMVFLIMERKWCERRLSHAYEDLLDAVAHRIPVLNSLRIQIEQQRLAARQAAALENLEAFIQAFRGTLATNDESLPRIAASMAADVEVFATKLDQLGSALDRGIGQLLQ